MIGEWDVAFELQTPEGSLTLNYTDPSTGRRFQLVPAKCNATLPVRVTEDDVPQGDGKIPHRRWRSGYGAHLAIEMLIDNAGELTCAGGADLVEMLDLLGLHVNAMIRTGLVSGLPNARLIWTPTGASDDRMFDRCQLLSAPITSLEGDMGGTLVEFDIDTPYPYYIERTETQTVLYNAGPEIIHNAGNTDYFLVAEAFGGTSYFELINHSVVDIAGNPLKVVYWAALPGAASIGNDDYVEIVFFQGSAQLNGNQANRKAGIDMRYTDYFPLIPGDNLVEAVGAQMLIKSNGAWA